MHFSRREPTGLVVRRAAPTGVLIRHTVRQVRVGAILVALACAGTAASAALSYVSTFPTVASRAQLVKSAGGVSGMSALMGSTAHIDTVGGYTTYKCFMFLTTIGAIWAVLAAARTFRGAESDGQAALLLSRPVSPAVLTRATATGLAIAVFATTVLTSLGMLLTGQDQRVGFSPHQAIAYAVSLTIAPLVFVALGAVASQVTRSRRSAAGLGLAVFGVFTVVRMIADSTASLHWLRWATPIGWVELMNPLMSPRWLPAALAAVCAAGLFAAAIAMSARRDVGDVWALPIFAQRTGAAASGGRTHRIRATAPLSLATRLEGSTIVAWWVGLLACGLVLGGLSKITQTAAPGDMGDMLTKFGTSGTFTRQYLGVAFLMSAVVVMLIPAALIGSMSDEVTSGRIHVLLAAPVTRLRWLWGRVVLILLAIVGAALLAGLGTWIGATSQGVDVSVQTMLGAGLNIAPLALVTCGIGLVAFVVAPRWAATTVYVVVLWSLFVDLVGSLISGAAWLARLSLFRYLALVPAAQVSMATQLILLVIAGCLMALASWLFVRGDL